MSRNKIRGSETLDRPQGEIVTRAGALRLAQQRMPADLRAAGFQASVTSGARGWNLNYSRQVTGGRV